MLVLVMPPRSGLTVLFVCNWPVGSPRSQAIEIDAGEDGACRIKLGDTITAKGCKIKVAAAWIENDGGGLCERIGFRGQIRKGCVVDIRIEIERRDGC